MFETEYGIFDHKQTNNPLASVRFNECEKFEDHYLLETYMDLFLYKKVHKYMGITFDEFLNRPRYEMDRMIEAIDRIQAKEATVNQNVLNDLSNANKADK